ncbi:MAG TPA: EfeM/EfeO family lipoprotein [Pseudonocardiaceae bacterium]|jgi:iron uptake system component EfeO|nr:EfeM/EfeO family lipoprotein [Pseudonocardiaceae bacterium]
MFAVPPTDENDPIPDWSTAVPDGPNPDGRDGQAGRRRPDFSTLGLIAVVVALIAVIAVVNANTPSDQPAVASSGPTLPPNTLPVSQSDCGSNWTEPKTGPQSLVIDNVGNAPAEADLVNVRTGAVLGEVEGLGANTSETMRVTLGPGAYALRCLIEDVDPITGPTVQVTGSGASSPGVVPVTNADLLEPLKQYSAYVTSGVADLVTTTDALQAAVHSGNLNAARTAWLPAHLAYERLGAAYNAFGDYDGEINGTTAGLPGGVQDSGFTGFHRVEYGLWHGESAASLTGPTDALDGYVHGLRNDLPKMETQALDLGLRAHEIMENTLQFEFTGKTDYGSGTSLATALANVQGDQEVVSVLRPLLTSRYPQLSQVDLWTSRLTTLLQARQNPDGTWTPVAQLSAMDRERLDAALSELTEQLAPIAAITEPRRVS